MLSAALSYEQHLRVARLALDRSWLAAEAISEVVRRLASASEPLELDAVWVGSGLLSAEQLAEAQRPTSEGPACPPNTPTVQLYAAPPSSAVSSAHSPTIGIEDEGSGVPSSLLSAPVDLRYWQRCALGEGGHGRVHRCIDVVLKRPVAVKMMRSELFGDHDTEQLLERESRILARLEHPNIIPIYDAGRDPTRGPYYVMREVVQRTLQHVIDGLRAEDPQVTRDFSQKRLLRQVMQIARAIDYANSRGVIHCDLKPANVLLGDFGQMMVADWGMAALEAEPYRPYGGTHGFMAPEQYRLGEQLDARTDVFALGAILYEVVALHPAIAPTATPPRPGAVDRWVPPPIEPPSARAPDRRIPVELDEICLMALRADPDERYPRAGAFADAIEQVLEGTRELERRAAEAERQFEVGQELASHYLELEAARPDTLAQLAALRQSVPPWAPLEEKRGSWEMEDMAQITDALRVRTFQAAVAAFEQAIDADPDHAAAHRGLATLYWTEREHARRRHDESNRIYFQQLAEQHDDGTLLGDATAGGVLAAVCDDSSVELTLEAYRERERRLVAADSRRLAPGEAGPHSLPTGSYRVVAQRDGRRLDVPVLVAAGSAATLRVDGAALDHLESDEVWVASGVALLGGAAETDATQPREVDVPAFVIQRFPVTFRAYLGFLDALGDREAGGAHVPRSDLGEPLAEATADGWRLRPRLHFAESAEACDLPVFGVSAESALSYAAWLSVRTGRVHRLPTDDEWEKAGRGVDGRLYPWGNHFDATFCRMRASRPGPSSPSPVGTFPTDESPFGVRDLAGGVADWTLPAPAPEPAPAGTLLVHSRGGAWCDPAADCRLAAHQEYAARARSQRVGFRLVRSAP